MTIRTSPPISLSDVLAELRITNPGRQYPISLGDPDVRALAGRPSGAISLSDLYGKSSYIPMTVYATGGFDTRNTSYGPGFAEATATATVTNGKGTKFFNWVVLEATNNPTMSGHSTAVLTATKSYLENASGTAFVRARCDVTDETGAVVTSPEVTIELTWEGIA